MKLLLISIIGFAIGMILFLFGIDVLKNPILFLAWDIPLLIVFSVAIELFLPNK